MGEERRQATALPHQKRQLAVPLVQGLPHVAGPPPTALPLPGLSQHGGLSHY